MPKTKVRHVRVTNNHSRADIAKVLDGFGSRFTPKQWECWLRPDQINNLRKLYAKDITIVRF